jgi:hypothetical protein
VAGNYSDHLDEYCERDRPLSFHWRTADFAQMLDLPCARNQTVNAILAEAILGLETGQHVSYSASKAFYSNGRRYRGTSYTYRSVLDAVAVAARAGLIRDSRQSRHRSENRGWQSSFVATDRLIECGKPLKYDQGESIWLKDAADNLIDYPETRLTARLRGELAVLNHALASVRIELPDVEWRGHHMAIGESLVLPIPGNPLHRIFSRSSWQMHGRAYGWFQSIPKTARISMRLNGEPLAECDYSCLHASILYNRQGVRMGGDAYDVGGSFDRDDVKLGFNIAINARTEGAAIAALSDRTGKGRKHAAAVLGAIKRHHKPIERYLFSDAGVRLMRTDSDLILTALRVVNEAGEPALPMHDALIVPARFADQTAAKMISIFESSVGRVSPCKVKIKSPSGLHMGERPLAPPPPSSPSLPSVM